MFLQPSVKHYPWGKIGSTSLVAKLLSANDSSDNNVPEEIDVDKPYAELWMGAHPSGPSIILLPQEVKTAKKSISLQDYITCNPSVLGENITSTFGTHLPFLFKVLSVEKALSIQAHPNKELASILHSNDPKNYPDSNHKPEMALAITPFEVLCGFRGLSEINTFIKQIPELRDIIGDTILATKDNLREAYRSLMMCNPDIIESKLSQLLKRTNENVPEFELIQRLQTQFPNDVGIWNVYFLQHFTLQPGEALFLPANEPHAYLSGDCMECMANSDNVVRAGLTPKFKDIDVLSDMLTFETGKDWLFPGRSSGKGKTIFLPPVPDFAIECLEVRSKDKKYGNQTLKALCPEMEKVRDRDPRRFEEKTAAAARRFLKIATK